MANRNSAHSRARQAGYTLAEVLVGVALFTVLSAVVVPAVINQIKDAELASAVRELESIRAGIIAFQTDVNRWPLEVNQLIRKPGSDDSGPDTEDGPNGAVNLDLVRDDPFPPGLLKKWNGPYLNLGGLPPSGNLDLVVGDSIKRVFETVCVNRSNYLAVVVEGVSQGDAKSISMLKDGDANVAIGDDAAGIIRWESATPDRMLYFAATLSPPKC